MAMAKGVTEELTGFLRIAEIREFIEKLSAQAGTPGVFKTDVVALLRIAEKQPFVSLRARSAREAQQRVVSYRFHQELIPSEPGHEEVALGFDRGSFRFQWECYEIYSHLQLDIFDDGENAFPYPIYRVRLLDECSAGHFGVRNRYLKSVANWIKEYAGKRKAAMG